MYALHTTTSGCKDGIIWKKQCLILFSDSLADVPFLFSITWSFFSCLTCPSDLLYCVLRLHRDNRRRCRYVLYWTLSKNSSPIVALITRRAVEENSQLSSEAFPKNSSGLLFLYQSPWTGYLKPSAVFECGSWSSFPLQGCSQGPSAGIWGLLFSWCSSLCSPFHPCSNSGRGCSRHESEGTYKCLSKMILQQFGISELWHHGNEDSQNLEAEWHHRFT